MFHEESYASFWGHMEELRKTLIRILAVVAVGFFINLYFYEPIFQLLVKPQSFSSPFSIETLHHERLTNTTNQPNSYKLPAEAKLLFESSGVKKESEGAYRIEGGHYLEYQTPSKISTTKLILLSPLEGIILTFKICFWLSLAWTSPIWVFLLLKFIFPALRKQERNIILPFIVGSFGFISIGLAVAAFTTIPLANQYLESFNSAIGQNLWALSHYVDYTLIIYLGHAVAAELCLILLFGVHYQLIEIDWLMAKRRYMIVLAFILGALLTPPDVLTQLMVAIPLVIVYELAILYGKMQRKRAKKRASHLIA